MNIDQTYEIFLPRPCVRVLLASFYSLAFIITPYWAMIGVHILQGKKAVVATAAILILTIGLGIVWSYISGEVIRLKISLKSIILFVVMIGVLAAINFNALNYDIPWRGDEDSHIDKTLHLAAIIPFIWVILFLILNLLFFYKISQKASGLMRIIGVLVIGIIPYLLFGYKLNDPTTLLRYPYVGYWFYALLPLIFGLFHNQYHEILFRIIPLISVAAIVVIFQSKSTSSWIIKLLLGISCALIPVVFYYSSIFYLELPAVVLMLIVCFRIRGLLEKDFKRIRQDPGWYALILIGFIKETVVSFLFCFLAFRILIFLVKKIQELWLRNSARGSTQLKEQVPFKAWLFSELMIGLSTLIPIVFYLLLRTYLVSVRSFRPHLSSLIDLSAYQAIGLSLLQQFGPYLLFFIGGLILLLVRKEYAVSGFFILLIVFIPLFHAVDELVYAGYSRFNLFILAPILVGSSIFFKWFFERKKVFATASLAGIIFINLFISPINSDGSKVPYWGNYLIDTSEHYYPYTAALSWIKYNDPGAHIIFAGANYPYKFYFDFNKLNWFPKLYSLQAKIGQSDASALSNVIRQSDKTNNVVILFQVLGKTTPAYPPDPSFDKVKIFQNQDHMLLVLYQ
ncbi:MAG: hypothetical protein P4L50_12280 [Anaerolineaceae bacterium]|nr:hypothetical protein [Anaerolineaceae bacterium]